MSVEPKVKYIFEALENAEITFSDYSRLTSITRQTLYNWKAGNPVSDRLRLDFAYSMAARITRAHRMGKLPLTDKLKTAQRIAVLRKIIADMARK